MVLSRALLRGFITAIVSVFLVCVSPCFQLTALKHLGSHHLHRTTDSHAWSVSPHFFQPPLDTDKQARISLPTHFPNKRIYYDHESRVSGLDDWSKGF